MGEGVTLTVLTKIKHVGVHPSAAGINKKLTIAAEGVVANNAPPDTIA
jgi:hypothetical protein